MKLRILNFFPILVAFPAVFIGVIAMYFNEVPMFIWIQNVVFFTIAGSISCFLITYKRNIRLSKSTSFMVIISILLLLLTFISRGIGGVHRWVAIGGLQINVSMVVLPALLLMIWKLSLKSLKLSVAVVLSVSIILFFQPDASQLTSFGLPAIVLLINRGVRKSVSLLLIVILFGLITTSWIFLDNLSSIAYVEEIVGLVAQMGIIWYISGILALILLPIPFVLFPPKHFVLPSTCIGMYFTLLLISTLFGSFPVPLMGYGASPILGFLIAITWYGRTKFSSLVKGESIDKEPL
ncbi:cell division protein [Priestia aryabhattai]|nr:cell division protein [Priestia aryabhattai]